MSTCPRCGALAALGSDYCARCGAPLDPSATPASGYVETLAPVSMSPQSSNRGRAVTTIIGVMVIVGATFAFLGHNLWKTVNHAQSNVTGKLDLNNAARAEEIYRAQYDTYTTKLSELEKAGFTRNEATSVSIATDGYNAFCIVAMSARGGAASKWFLHDSARGGLSETAYDDRASAEAACSLGAAGFEDGS